jgi:endonuclease-3 related protein
MLSARKKLLGINGIGRETADSIILYALNKPIFVVDV